MRVLIVGDYCEDIFVRGRVERLCPEAPCPVLNPVRTIRNDGMAGNVAANVKSLEPDSEVRVIFQGNHITKTRYVDQTSGYILLRVDENDKAENPLSFESFVQQYDMYRPIDGHFDIVLISDYNKGFLTEQVIHDITNYVQNRGSLVFLDTKKQLGEWSNFVDFVKINEKEFGLLVPGSEKWCRNMIVTLGPRGSKHLNTGIVVPSKKVDVMDVSGAGDTYFAAFSTHYCKYRNVADAMSFANSAASVAVSKHGVVAVKQSEVNAS